MANVEVTTTGDPNIRRVITHKVPAEDAQSPATTRGDICLVCGRSDKGLPLSGWVRKWLLARGWNPSIYVNLRDVVTVFARRELSA